MRLRSSALLAFVFACVLLSAHQVAHALVRQFPVNSRQVKIQAINEPYLKAGGKNYLMPPGLIIFNTGNMTIVRGALPVGVTARIQLDLNGDVRRIWILNPEEIGAASVPPPQLPRAILANPVP